MPPRKRQRTTKQADPDTQRPDDDIVSASAADGPDTNDTSQPVLGGMAGGWRVTGEETTSEGDGITGFKVSFNDKNIVCQLYRGQQQPLKDEAPKLIFTHGAGGGLANPATADFAEGFAEVSPVLCFQGTMNLQNRVKTFKAVANHVGFSSISEGKSGEESKKKPVHRVALGGRSMGARAACIAAQDIRGADALVLVSYPLTSEKGSQSRAQPLYDLPASSRVLFISGDRDKMCGLAQLNDVRGQMKAPSSLCIVKGADHAMSLKGGKDRVQAVRRKTGGVAASFIEDCPSVEKMVDSVIEVGNDDGEFEVKHASTKPTDRKETSETPKREAKVMRETQNQAAGSQKRGRKRQASG